jgi:hypothetical protein
MSDHRHDSSLQDPSDEELILYHYGEAEDAEAIAARLAVSPAARQRYAELRRLLAAADQWTPPELAASFESDVWRRLQPRLAEQQDRLAALAAADETSSRGAQRPSDPDPARATNEPVGALLDAAHRYGSRTRRWLPAAAAAMLLLALGYLAGRFAPTTTTPAAPTLSVEARQRILVETLAGHLERSQRLFTELANEPEDGVDLAASQQAARQLLAANRLYRTAAERGGREGVAALLDEMEPVLLELAHLPAEPQPEDLEFLRRRVETKGLLFKTRVASELLTRSLAAPAATRPQRSTV